MLRVVYIFFYLYHLSILASAANLSRAAASAAASAANLSRAAASATASRQNSRAASNQQSATPAPTSAASALSRQHSRSQSAAPASRAQPRAAASASAASNNGSVVEVIFKSIDRQNHGRISVEDAEKILLRLNSRLNRQYGEDDVQAFFSALDINHDNTIDLEEFRNAFKKLNVA